MPRRTFASQKELQDYAEQIGRWHCDLMCLRLRAWAETMHRLPASQYKSTSRPAGPPAGQDAVPMSSR